MSDEHDRYREWVAAYALGALEPDERAELEEHLAGCRRCAQELAAVAPLPGLLARVEPDEVSNGGVDAVRAGAVADAAAAELGRLVRSRRRWRLLGIAAATLALVLAVGIGAVLVAGSDSDGPGPDVELTAAELVDSRVAAASIGTRPRPWGTEISIELRGLPERARYRLWAVDADGNWSGAATWSPTPARAAILTGASGTPTPELERIVVTSDDRADVLVEATV